MHREQLQKTLCRTEEFYYENRTLRDCEKPPENPDKIRQRKANKRPNRDLMAFSEMSY